MSQKPWIIHWNKLRLAYLPNRANWPHSHWTQWIAGWVLCFALIFITTYSPLAQCSEPAGPLTGPARDEEIALLWEQGKTAHSAGKNEDCIRALDRLILRYTGSKHFQEAHLLVAQCYLRTGQNEEAQARLKYSIESPKRGPQAIRARLDLGRVQNRLQKFSESLLLSNELLKTLPNGPERAEALLNKATALLGLKKNDRAIQALQAFDTEGGALATAELKGEAKYLDLELQVRKCQEIFPGQITEEGRLIIAYRNQGQCLKEVVLKLKAMIHAELGAEWIENAQKQVVHVLSDYVHSPEGELPRPATKRKGTQLIHYLKELREALTAETAKFKEQTELLLDEWAKQAQDKAKKAMEKIRTSLHSLSKEGES